MNGCLKMLMVSVVLGFIGVLILGVIGGVAYMNREKLGIPPMEEWADLFKMELNEAGKQAVANAGRADGSAGSDGGAAGESYVKKRPVAASAPMHVDKKTFARYAKRSDVLVLVDYYADWCGPCRRLAPSLVKLAQTHGDKVIVLKVNVDTEGELAQQAGVSNIPDVRLLHGGEQVDQFVGAMSYEKIEKMILKHESILPPPQSVPALDRAGGTGSIDPVTKQYLPPGMSRK